MRTEPNEPSAHNVQLDDDEEIQIHNFELDKLLHATTTFAASPGYYVLHADEEAPGEYWKYPVIGWAVGNEGETSPITVDGVNDGLDTTQNVLTPDGQVIRSNHRTWPTLEDFLGSRAKVE